MLNSIFINYNNIISKMCFPNNNLSKSYLAGFTSNSVTSFYNFINNYNKSLSYFSINTVYKGNKNLPSIIFINGFLQKDEKVNDWLKAVSPKFPNNTKIWVNWDSKKLEELLPLFFNLNFNIVDVLPKFMVDFWYTAEHNAEKAGLKLANELMQRNNKAGYILMGHSLGCRVAYNAANEICKKSNVKIDSMYLLSGAIGNKGWELITKRVKNKIYNFYSPEDAVLLYAYQLASAGMAEPPIGIAPISLQSFKIKNKNVTKTLEKYSSSSSFIHMRYKDAFKEILQTVY